MDEVKPLSLAVVMGLTLDIAGTLHVYGLADAEDMVREGITATILLVVAVLWLLLRRGTDEQAERRVPLLFALLPMVAAMISMSDIMSHVASGWTWGRAALFGGGSLLLFVLAVRRAPAAAIALVALVLGIILRYINTRHIPIEPARGDMLPLVQGAMSNLLAGRSPYTTYTMPWEVPLTYLPLTWLTYAPAYLLNVDLRWINILAEVAILGAVWFVARPRSGGTSVAGEQAVILWSWLFLSPSIIRWDLFTTAPIGWAAIAWTIALILRSRHRAAAVALGLTAATTPLIAVFGSFIALYWLREAGWLTTARRLAQAGLVCGILLLPWIAWTPEAFLDGTVHWFNDLDRFPREKWVELKTWDEITGYSGFFWIWMMEHWLKPIQMSLLVVVVAIYTLRGARLTDLGRHTTAAFTLFMLFNPVLWPYLYNPALVTTLLTIATAGLHEPASVRAQAGVVQSRRSSRLDKDYSRSAASYRRQ